MWGLAGCGCFGFGVVFPRILFVIALPSLLAQDNKARQPEAKTYVGSLNRAQQAYFIKNKTFTDSLEATGIGISAQTENYTYQIGIYETQPPVAISLAKPTQDSLKGYAGFVFLTPVDDSHFNTSTILCETATPVSRETPLPSPQPTASMECPAGFVGLN